MKVGQTLVLIALTSVLVLWAYWPEFGAIAEKWHSEEEYSHGWLVPLFSLLLLRMRIPQLLQVSTEQGKTQLPLKAFLAMCIAALMWVFGASGATMTPVSWIGLVLTVITFAYFFEQCVNKVNINPGGNWMGLLLVALAGIGRLAAVRYNAEWVDNITLIPLLLGLAWTLGGVPILRWTAPSICYLVFMIPLPFRIEVALRQPLRQIATTSSTFTLQTLGYPAFSEGNQVIVEDVNLDIVEACSGLSMLMVFFAISCAVALLSDRTLWQKAIVILSAVPIAIFSNVVRITVQGLLFINHFPVAANWFHDQGAPWLMMMVAMGILLFELWYLDRLFIIEMKEPVRLGLDRDGANMVSTPLSN